MGKRQGIQIETRHTVEYHLIFQVLRILCENVKMEISRVPKNVRLFNIHFLIHLRSLS